MLPDLAPLALLALTPFLPQAAVDSAMEEARAAGYAPCTPQVVLTERGKPFGGTAAWPEMFGRCEIEITPETVEADDYLTYVARHEVCHLSTGAAIDRDPPNPKHTDRYHQHLLFTTCLATLEGTIPAPVPEPDPPAPPSHAFTLGGFTITATIPTPLTIEADYQAMLCAEIKEVKLDIEC